MFKAEVLRSIDGSGFHLHLHLVFGSSQQLDGSSLTEAASVHLEEDRALVGLDPQRHADGQQWGDVIHPGGSGGSVSVLQLEVQEQEEEKEKDAAAVDAGLRQAATNYRVSSYFFQSKSQKMSNTIPAEINLNRICLAFRM